MDAYHTSSLNYHLRYFFGLLVVVSNMLRLDSPLGDEDRDVFALFWHTFLAHGRSAGDGRQTAVAAAAADVLRVPVPSP